MSSTLLAPAETQSIATALPYKKPEQTNLAETALTLDKLRKVLELEGEESSEMYVYDKNGNKVTL